MDCDNDALTGDQNALQSRFAFCKDFANCKLQFAKSLRNDVQFSSFTILDKNKILGSRVSNLFYLQSYYFLNYFGI
jgi:hypothetical protein